MIYDLQLLMVEIFTSSIEAEAGYSGKFSVVSKSTTRFSIIIFDSDTSWGLDVVNRSTTHVQNWQHVSVADFCNLVESLASNDASENELKYSFVFITSGRSTLHWTSWISKAVTIWICFCSSSGRWYLLRARLEIGSFQISWTVSSTKKFLCCVYEAYTCIQIKWLKMCTVK